MTKLCRYCGQPFEAVKKHHNNKLADYCSVSCAARGRYDKTIDMDWVYGTSGKPLPWPEIP